MGRQYRFGLSFISFLAFALKNGCACPGLKTARIPYVPIILPASPCVSPRAWSIMRFVDRVEIIIHYVRAMQNILIRDQNRPEVDSARRADVSNHPLALVATSCCESAH